MKRIGNIKNNYTRGENEYEKINDERKKRSKSRLGLRIMGSRMLGLNKKGGITMKKMTKQEK
ncbi:hypothetical protein, partial [Enterococcus haemoperoxidus]|uniref:hypothetical protein n=1 Tax=Enterococcus haemoperoxidus TaxID=155618 RepID=UPI001B804FE8